MALPINKCQIAFLIDTNLASCEECNHINEILLTVTRLLLFYAENCKKPVGQKITTDERETQQNTKQDIQWGFKFFNSSITNFKKSTFHSKFENIHKSSIKEFEKSLKEAFNNSKDDRSVASKLCSHAAYFLSKALTEILHDFNWSDSENLNFTSPITRKRGNFQVVDESTVNVRKIIFVLTKSPSSQRALRRFSNKLIMDAEVFLDSFMSPALLNEYQNKYKMAVHWIDMTSEQCKTSFDTDRLLQNETVKVRSIITETCKILGGNFIAKDDILKNIPATKDSISLAEKHTCAVSSQNVFNFLPIEVCLDQLVRPNSSMDELAQVFVSGKNLDDLVEQLVPLTKNHHLRKEDQYKGLDLKNARITWMGCVPHKDVVHLLATKIMTSFILDCNGSDQLSQLHSLLQKTATLGVLSVTKDDLETVHISVLQPFANGIAILSILNPAETFHGEKGLLDKPLAENVKSDQKGLQSRLVNTFLDHVKEQKQRSSPVKPVAQKAQVDSVYQSHYLNSWYMPGSLPGMSAMISRLNISAGNSETTSRSDKSFLKELRKHYIKEKQPHEVVENFQPSTSTPLCAIRKKKADSADSDASTRSSRVGVRALRSSTLSRGRLMVDKARSASVLNTGETDASLLSTPSSPDKRSCDSDNYLHIADLKSEQDLKTHLLKLYGQVLSAGVAVESTIRAIVSVSARFMTSLQYSNPHKSAADFIRQLLVKTSKELKDKYTQNTDKNTKIAEYKVQILLLLELEFVKKTEETDNSSLLNELTLLLRGLMFLTETKYLNDFLNDTIIVSYSAALPQLLADVYDELMLPLPPALSKFASPVSTKPSLSESNEESFLSAPGSSTQVSSHHSDQASQQTRSRFKQHPSISDFRHSKQILVKPKPKVEAKSKTKEKVKVKTRSSRKRHAVDIGRAKRNLFSDNKSKVSQNKPKDEVRNSHKKKSKHSGKSKTLVLGTPSHKQTSQRFIRQQERLRQRENIDPDVKVVAESPLKEDDNLCLTSAVTKSARHLLRESFYSSSSQPSRHFSKSLELSQTSSSKINISQENQVHFSKSQGTLSSALRGDSPNISPRTRFMKSFIASPSPKHKAKSLLRRSPRKSSKKLDFKNSAGRVSTEDVHLIFDGENANDFSLMVSPTRRRFSEAAAAMGYKTPEKKNNALQWETASCPPLMVTPVKRFDDANSELGFKNAISQSGDKRSPRSKTPLKNMVLRSTPTRSQKKDCELSLPFKGAGKSLSVEYKSPKKVSDIYSCPAQTRSLMTTRAGANSSFESTPKKVELDEHYSTPKKLNGQYSQHTPNKVKFYSKDLGCPLVERFPPSIKTATPKKSILKNSPLIKVARRVELQAVTSTSRPYSFMGRGFLDSRLSNALSKQESFVHEKCSKQDGDYTSPEHGRSICSSRLQDGHLGQGNAPATVTIRTPSPSHKTKYDSINTWARRKKCIMKQYSPPSNDILSPAKTSKVLFHSSPHRNVKETQATEVETPKKATSCLETLHPRKRSLFLVDDVVESPSKRLRKCPESPYSKVPPSLIKTDTVDFDPGKSPLLFDDERDGYADFKDFQPSSASVFSQSSNSQHSTSLPVCVLTPVKRVTRNSSAAMDEGSQGFPVFIPSVDKESIASVRQQCVQVQNVQPKTDSPQPINAQSSVFIEDKKQYSPILSSNGLRSLIASPLLSPTSLSDPRLYSSNSRSTHSKSRKHLELQ